MATEQAQPTTASGSGWVSPANIETSGATFASYAIPANPVAPPSGGGGGTGGGTRSLK
jgi:hypothetical protein